MFSTYVILGLAIIVCTYAQVSLSPAHIEKMKSNPRLKWSKQARHPRDVTLDKREEEVYGTPGYDSSVYGNVGFEDATSQYLLKGKPYGSRVGSYIKLEGTSTETVVAAL